MRLPSRSGVSAEDAATARDRVVAIRRRRGWVPQVPPGARSREWSVPAAEAGQAGVPGQVRRGGRHARRADEPEADLAELWSRESSAGGPSYGVPDAPGGQVAGDVGEAADDETPGARPSVLDPLADRLPLPMRAVLAGLPAGVRGGAAGLSGSHALVVVLIIALGLAVTAVVAGLGRPRVAVTEPVAVSTVLATGTTIDGSHAGPTREDHVQVPATGLSEVVVHVVGLVAEPGIVVLPAESRVVDAVDAAGGIDDDVDLLGLNLARVLTDGEQIFVGIEPPPGAEPPVPAAGGQAPGLIDLNAATIDTLETLPGVGPALAQRIVAWREQNGRFTAVDELLEVPGIGPVKYAAVADLVTV